jgi:hypothetical protein
VVESWTRLQLQVHSEQADTFNEGPSTSEDSSLAGVLTKTADCAGEEEEGEVGAVPVVVEAPAGPASVVVNVALVLGVLMVVVVVTASTTGSVTSSAGFGWIW